MTEKGKITGLFLVLSGLFGYVGYEGVTGLMDAQKPEAIAALRTKLTEPARISCAQDLANVAIAASPSNELSISAGAMNECVEKQIVKGIEEKKTNDNWSSLGLLAALFTLLEMERARSNIDRENSKPKPYDRQFAARINGHRF